MTDDHMNGVALLLEDIKSESQRKRMSAKDRIILKSLDYILRSIPPIREDVNNLKSTSVGYRAWQRPKLSFVIFFLLYSFAISDLSTPMFQWISGMVGTIMKGF